jgi:tripartite-type tricarboxylate transporter receptor subunit TctC
MFRRISLAAIGLWIAATGAALAQAYPSKPVTMIIPFAAGGPTDVLGRVMAQRMSELLGQQVVVENVGGAGGMTGSKRVADAAPDGYTFVLGTVGTHAQGQTLYKKPLYNAATDFAPVALIAEVPIVLITRKDLPVSNLKEFIAYAKANQSKMQYGSAGAGSATHLGCVLLNYLIGVDITHVPYRGTGPAMQDLRRSDRLPVRDRDHRQAADRRRHGEADRDHDQGALESVAERADRLEQGTPDLEAYTWNAIFLPKGAPADIVKKLNDAAVEAMKTPTVRERLEGLGAVIVPEDRATPEQLAQFVQREIEKWAAPIKASGVTVD